MSVLLWVIGAIASAFLGLLFTLLFQDQISLILVRILRGFWVGGERRTVSGDWYTYYSVSPERGTSVSAAAPNDAVVVVRLRHLGNRVAGMSVTKHRDYTIIGTLQDRSVLTGTWCDYLGGRYSWGALQLWWLSNGRGMVGKFVGKDAQNHINHGIWLWARTRDELYALADWAASNGGYILDSTDLKRRIDMALDRLNASDT